MDLRILLHYFLFIISLTCEPTLSMVQLKKSKIFIFSSLRGLVRNGDQSPTRRSSRKSQRLGNGRAIASGGYSNEERSSSERKEQTARLQWISH